MIYILIAIASSWFAAFSKVPNYVSKVLFNFGIKKRAYGVLIPIRLLPFDCDKCLGFWLGFIYGAINESLWIAVVYGACSSMLAMTVTLIINKLR